MFTFLIFKELKNNLINISINAKHLVINKLASPSGAPFADANEAIFKLPLVTGKKKLNLHQKIQEYLHIYQYIYLFLLFDIFLHLEKWQNVFLHFISTFNFKL